MRSQVDITSVCRKTCCAYRLLSRSLLAASLNFICSGVSVLLLNRYNSLLLLSLSSLSILQNITDSIDSRTESYLNYLPLRLTTVRDCTHRHLLVNPTILYHVRVNNKRLSALYNLPFISRGINHHMTIYGVSVIFVVYFS